DVRERRARGAPYSPMVDLGFNCRLSDLQCALVLSQLAKLETFLKRRAAIAERYTAALDRIEAVTVPSLLPHGRHAWHIFPVLLQLEQLAADRNTVLAALRAEGIGATVHYVPTYCPPYSHPLRYPPSPFP